MKNKLLLLIAGAIAFASCKKIPDYEDLSSEFVVSTNFDKTAAFDSYKTYYISDTVTNFGGSGADTLLVGTVAQQLVAAVKSNMSSRGYTFVPAASKPELALKMGVVDVVNIDVYPGWYSGYAGWFPFFWAGYYPYYYPWTTVYTYDTGTVIIDAYDVKNAAANGQYKAIWNITSFGALGSDADANLTRGVNSINQGFQQSPYLITK